MIRTFHGLVVLDTNRWPRIEAHITLILSAIEAASGGSFLKVDCF